MSDDRSPALDRYHRQILLPPIGEDGQRRLARAHALIVGCGALGAALSETLARAGFGRLTIVDRDVVELTNLQRQVLYDEQDVRRGRPKAVAAKGHLARINSAIQVEAKIEDFNPRNAEALLGGAQVILDGLDNFQTRYLLNDLAVKHRLPYVYGGAVGTGGVSLLVLPRPRPGAAPPRRAKAVTWSAGQSTPCLRCIFPEAPPPGSAPTCDTAGVLAPAVAVIAAHQAAQAIKLLTGHLEAVDRGLLSVDLWSNEARRFDVAGAGQGGSCPCCGRGRFEFLEGRASGTTTALCGRHAVQITPAHDSREAGGERAAARLDLAAAAARLAPHGTFACNEFLLRGVFAGEKNAEGEPLELMLFPTGRAIIRGTGEPERARAIYARYVGV